MDLTRKGVLLVDPITTVRKAQSTKETVWPVVSEGRELQRHLSPGPKSVRACPWRTYERDGDEQRKRKLEEREGAEVLYCCNRVWFCNHVSMALLRPARLITEVSAAKVGNTEQTLRNERTGCRAVLVPGVNERLEGGRSRHETNRSKTTFPIR